MQNSKKTQRWFSAQEVADRFGIHAATVWKWSQRGVLPRPGVIGVRTSRWSEESILELEEVLRNGGNLLESKRRKGKAKNSQRSEVA